MKILTKTADRYLENSDWKDVALIKTCMFTMGVLAGLASPAKYRKLIGIAAGVLFTATYEPVMDKFVHTVIDEMEEEKEVREIKEESAA